MATPMRICPASGTYGYAAIILRLAA